MDQIIYSIVSVKKQHKELNALLVELKGISGSDLYDVFFDDVTAVVSNIHRNNVVASRPNIIEYADVIETLSQQFTLLPVRFGSVMESTDVIIKMLGRNYAEIQSNLRKVENKVEFGLKVFCDPEKAGADTRATVPVFSSDENSSGSGHSVYRNYLDKKLQEHRIQERHLAQIDLVIQDITDAFAHLNPLHKFQKMVTAANIINDLLLLGKDKKSELVLAVEELQKKYKDLQMLLTGPWPPYNFVDFKII